MQHRQELKHQAEVTISDGEKSSSFKIPNIWFNNANQQENSEIKSEHKDDIDYKSEYPGMEIKDEPMGYGKIIDI